MESNRSVMLLAAMLLLAILLPRLADRLCKFNAALPVFLLPMPSLGRRCTQLSVGKQAGWGYLVAVR